jgi:hypothetical protein
MREAGAPRPAEKPRASLFDLVMRLVDDAVLVVRSEFRLTWGEIRSSLAEAAANLALVVVGAMLIGVALMFLLAGLLVWLSSYVGIVAAALIAAAIAIILGGLTLFAGLKRLQASELAQRTKAANLVDNTAAPAPAKGD